MVVVVRVVDAVAVARAVGLEAVRLGATAPAGTAGAMAAAKVVVGDSLEGLARLARERERAAASA